MSRAVLIYGNSHNTEKHLDYKTKILSEVDNCPVLYLNSSLNCRLYSKFRVELHCFDETGKTSEPLFNELMKAFDHKPVDKTGGLKSFKQRLLFSRCNI